MPFVLIGVGLVMVLTGINDTYAQFGAQLQTDMSAGFFKWAAAIVIIGAFGYIKDLKEISTLFLVLVVVSLFLANKGGVFSQLNSALSNLGQSGATSAVQTGG